MKLTELDEWQGITADMIRSWLTAQSVPLMGCPSFPICPYLGEHTHHGHDITNVVTIPTELGGNRQRSAMVLSSLRWLASKRNMSEQALLREINPRMRKGMPSKAARKAHNGFWLAVPDFACMGAHAPIVITFDGDGFGVWHPEGFALPDSKPKTAASWQFWPCDANGNKVRWPTDAEGNML